MTPTTVNDGSRRSRVLITMGAHDPRFAVLPVLDGLESEGFVYRRRDGSRMILTSPTATVWLSFVAGEQGGDDQVVIDAWGVSADQLVEHFVSGSLEHSAGSEARIIVEGTIANIEVAVAA